MAIVVRYWFKSCFNLHSEMLLLFSLYKSLKAYRCVMRYSHTAYFSSASGTSSIHMLYLITLFPMS